MNLAEFGTTLKSGPSLKSLSFDFCKISKLNLGMLTLFFPPPTFTISAGLSVARLASLLKLNYSLLLNLGLNPIFYVPLKLSA